MPQISDPDFIGAWSEDDTVMLFFHKAKQSLIAAICRQHACKIIYEADMDYDDWENGSAITPFSVGNLLVAPAWSLDNADIRLDPSVVFGNGFHPTTRLCLEALIDVLQSGQDSFSKALDLGCGTGLLALAAAQKGVNKVLAVDNNALACQVARANARLNNQQDSVEVKELDLIVQCPDTEVDLLTVNLHHELLVHLFQTPSFWQSKYYIISGFFTHKEDVLLAAMPTDKVRFLDRKQREKWGLWVLQRR